MKKIPGNIIEILEQVIINKEERSIIISTELDRKAYTQIDEVLQSIRGKWNSSAKVHLFPFDPTGPLNEILRTKEIEPKNSHAYFPTPKKAVDVMFELINKGYLAYGTKEKPMRVLEPSAGTGGIADEVMGVSEHIELDLVEIFKPNQEILQSKGYEVHAMDFMDYTISEDEAYDFILMNPPFSLPSDKKAYMSHVMHAHSMLKPAGELVAIVPCGWLTSDDKKSRAFRDMMATYGGHVATLEGGIFKESGTMIETKVIVLGAEDWKVKPHAGYESYYIWEFMLYATQERELAEKYYALMEKEGVTKEELKSFADEVIEDCASREIFLSNKYIEQYVRELFENTIEGERLSEIEYLKRSVKRLHNLRFSERSFSMSVLDYTYYSKFDFTAEFVSSIKEDCLLHDVQFHGHIKQSAIFKNEEGLLSLEEQSSILRGGGDLLSLMT